MARFLFVFGYESPTEWRTNADQETDFESSNAVWVVASSKEQALEAGRRFAENWAGKLFQSAGIASYEGWAAGHPGGHYGYSRHDAQPGRPAAELCRSAPDV